MKSISLSGRDWRMAEANSSTFYSAAVPGNVLADLQDNRLIPDPFYGKNAQQCQWVKDKGWVYEKSFIVEEPHHGGAFLVFHGVDYECSIVFNEKEIGSHRGMFSPQYHNVSCLLKPHNTVRVHLEPLGKFRRREDTFRVQMPYGWDFCPRLLSPGIWDEAELILFQNVFIKDAWIRTENSGSVNVVMALFSLKPQTLALYFKIGEKSPPSREGRKAAAGEDTVKLFSGESRAEGFETVSLKEGWQEISFKAHVENPELWFPWDRGKSTLYTLDVSLSSEDTADTFSEMFGFRSAVFEKHPQDMVSEHGWVFLVNGKKEFIRGVNWVPMDVNFGRVDKERYKKLLTLVKDSGANMVRVWGGGLREKKDFYRLCDEMGLLVWQEFPFACNFLFSIRTDKDYLGLVEQECKSMIEKLRNHPAVVVFCGGNEISPKRNKKVVQLLSHLCASLDGARPFHSASPSQGESHDYNVWHGFGNVSDYLKNNSPFVSEFGVQSFPCMETLKKAIPEKYLFSVKPAFLYRLYDYGLPITVFIEHLAKWIPKSHATVAASYWGYHNAQLLKHDRYLKHVYPLLESLSLQDFVHLSQLFQAHALQVAIEHHRRGKYRVGGTLFWQFNEPWPAVTWSVVDYFLNPKIAYQKLKTLYQPCLVSLLFPLRRYLPGETLKGTLFIINDMQEDLDALSVEMFCENHQVFEKRGLSVKADSVMELGKVSVVLPAKGEALSQRPSKLPDDPSEKQRRQMGELKVLLLQKDRLLTENAYYLSLADSGNATFLQKTLYKLFVRLTQ